MRTNNQKWSPDIDTTEKLLFLFFEVIRAILLLETFDPACGIDVFLLACVERMAGGAYFCVDFACGRAGFKGIPAAAVNHDFVVFRMYVFLHILLPNNQKHYSNLILVLIKSIFNKFYYIYA